jgi:hypothetical protein
VTRPFDSAKLATLYPGGRDEYIEMFGAAAESARAAGFLLEADIPEILAVARVSFPD